MNIEEYCEKYLSMRQRHIERNKSNVSLEKAEEAMKAIGSHIVNPFVIDNANKEVYRDVLTWCLGQEGKLDLQKGLYIYGNTGTGKTLMMAIMSNVSSFYRVGVFDSNGNGWNLMEKKARADEICDDYAEDGDIQRWVGYPSLCIDDLGSEPSETLYMGNRRRVLRSIIEQRADRADRLTCFTSNFPPDSDEIVQMYGQRVRSRLHQMCNIILLPGGDRRI